MMLTMFFARFLCAVFSLTYWKRQALYFFFIPFLLVVLSVVIVKRGSKASSSFSDTVLRDAYLVATFSSHATNFCLGS